MREVTPIERALAMLEEFERKIELMKSELAAHLPDDDRKPQDWLTDPLTGRRRQIKRRAL